jgi:AcrR family transcriptional regulator
VKRWIKNCERREKFVSVNAPLQARSQETLNRIEAACQALLEEKSFKQISMNTIAKRAGISLGNLYNRF